MATNQFVHIGDVHLQSGSTRNAARLQALDQIIDEGLRLPDLAAWLIPGDLFHARSSIQDRNDLAARLLRMGEKASVLLAYGNHDLPGELDIMARLKTRFPIYVSTRPEVLTVPLATGDTAAVAVLPYPSRGNFVSSGVAKDDVVPTAAPLLDAIFMQFAHELSALHADGAILIFIGHVNVAGSIASTGQPQIGKEIEINEVMLRRLPVVYRGLSHIHRAQTIGCAQYAGSIAPNDWGERERKSYVLLTCTRLADGSWSAVSEERPIHVNPLFHVEGELTREAFTWRATKGPGGAIEAPPASWAGCEVRVRFTFQQSEKSVLDDSLVRAPFAAAARLDVEPIAVPDRALRSPEVAAARTLADKLVAWTHVAGVTASESVLAKLARLEHGDPAHLLADLQAALARLEDGATAPASPLGPDHTPRSEGTAGASPVSVTEAA